MGDNSPKYRLLNSQIAVFLHGRVKSAKFGFKGSFERSSISEIQNKFVKSLWWAYVPTKFRTVYGIGTHENYPDEIAPKMG